MSDLVRLDELFEIQWGTTLKASDQEPGSTAYVGASALNNGVTGRYDVEPNLVAGCVTVARSGSVGYATYQAEPVFITNNVIGLIPKSEMTVETLMFYATAIQANAFRFGYSRPMTTPNLGGLMVPAQVPDWVQEFDVGSGLDPKVDRLPFMPEVLASLPSPKTWHRHDFDEFFVESEPMSDQQVVLPDVSTWGSFRLDELFQIKKPGSLTMKDIEEGIIPLVSAKSSNNSVAMLADVEADQSAGSITVTVDGETGYATVQPDPFKVASNVVVLTELHHGLSMGSKMFVCGLIREVTRETFGYGRKLNGERLNGLMVKLPIIASGEPDWGLIEAYMLTLKWSQTLT